MIPGPRAGWPTEIQAETKLGSSAVQTVRGQRVAPRNFNNGYCLDTGSVTGLIKWRKPPLEKKKEKAAPAEKSGGTRLGAKVERARGETAYGFLVNVFRAYYLLVLPYTIAVPLLFDVAFSSFLFFLFLDSISFFFFSRYLAISGLMPPVIFPRIVSFDTSNFILRVLHARITRICCHFLSSLLFIFFSPFLLDDNDDNDDSYWLS